MTTQKRTVGIRGAMSRVATASKVGISKLGNAAIATSPEPSANVGQGGNRTQLFTYFTKVAVTGSEIPVLYSGDRLWARVKLTLETAGPVVVGQASQILPVLSGKGILLSTNQEREVTIAKGTKLYIASTSVNRVRVVIEPFPWLEQIFATIKSWFTRRS